MSLAEGEGGRAVGTSPVQGVSRRGSLHRLAEVRQQEGISRRTIARRLHTTVAAVKAMEESEDISLSQLYAWQQALRVPLGELLQDPPDPLSPPVLTRARMVRLMKTASAIFHWSRQKSIRRLAHMLMEHLVELMPELARVGPWSLRGRRPRSHPRGPDSPRSASSSTLARHS